MKLHDETHHLVSSEFNSDEKKTFIQILKIKSKKQISLTATLKISDDNQEIIANNHIEHFGEIIVQKSLLWSIENNIVCDYVIQTICSDDKEIINKYHITDEIDKQLFLSAFCALKSISEKNSHHILIYSNCMSHSIKIIDYIKLLLSQNICDIPEIYYSNYNSNQQYKEQKNILNRFESTKYGIISCVYCLGEGYDNKLIDAVVFSENMSSNIRIVQSALRSGRKNNQEPNKISKIILPILLDSLYNENNQDLKKVREIVYQIGLEDELVFEKIKAFEININEKLDCETEKNDTLNEYNQELTEQLKLKIIKRSEFKLSYDKAKTLLSEKNIRSKYEYYNLCNKDNRFPKEPEIEFKKEFTNWIDYLGIERVYYDLETCKKKIQEYLIKYPELKKNYLDLSMLCCKLTLLDKLFPPSDLWSDYYNVNNLQVIFFITNSKKKSGGVNINK
jgi:predicted helicase